MASLLAIGIGVALFAGGLLLMRHGLRRLLWHRLQRTLCIATQTPLRGLLAGIITAVLFQSSTAVCLMTIGLVTAEYLTFRQSLGLILGANIGTCSTLGLIEFIYTEKALPILLAASLLCLATKKTRTISITLIGLASMFCGLYVLNRGILVLQDFTSMQSLLLLAKETAWHGLIAGVFVTFVFQSSSAATAMLMTLADANAINIASAAHVVYGANLGSCLSSVLVSALAPKAAKRVAAAHVLLNILGILLFLPATTLVVRFLMLLTADPSVQVAALHTVFNIVTSLVVLPFTTRFSRIVEKIIP